MGRSRERGREGGKEERSKGDGRKKGKKEGGDMFMSLCNLTKASLTLPQNKETKCPSNTPDPTNKPQYFSIVRLLLFLNMSVTKQRKFKHHKQNPKI